MSTEEKRIKDGHHQRVDRAMHKRYAWERKKTYDRFTDHLRKGSHILDLGCGYGYDSKYFIEQGYLVTPVDESHSRCEEAQAYIGIPVIEASFDAYQPDNFFDAVWTVNALVHIHREELVHVINQVTQTLKPHGVFFLAVPYGDFEEYKEGQLYSYLNEDWLEDAEMHLNGLRVEECYIEEAHDEEGELKVWLSVLMTKE